MIIDKLYGFVYRRLPVYYWESRRFWIGSHLLLLGLILIPFPIVSFLGTGFLESVNANQNELQGHSIEDNQFNLALLLSPVLITVWLIVVVTGMVRADSYKRQWFGFLLIHSCFTLIVVGILAILGMLVLPLTTTDGYFINLRNKYYRNFIWYVSLIFIIFYIILNSVIVSRKLREEHVNRVLFTQEEGLEALKQITTREAPGTVLPLAQVATRSHLSQGEVQWVLNHFYGHQENTWRSNAGLLTITSGTAKELDRFITEIRAPQMPTEASPPTVTHILSQLEEVALPLTSVKKQLGLETDAEVFFGLNEEARRKNEYVTRIDASYITTKTVQYHCQLCKKELTTTPYRQCLQCQQHLCQDDYEQLQLSGQSSPTCLECGGVLVSLPAQCEGCHMYYLAGEQWKGKTHCPYCGNHIRLPAGKNLHTLVSQAEKHIPTQGPRDIDDTKKSHE